MFQTRQMHLNFLLFSFSKHSAAMHMSLFSGWPQSWLLGLVARWDLCSFLSCFLVFCLEADANWFVLCPLLLCSMLIC